MKRFDLVIECNGEQSINSFKTYDDALSAKIKAIINGCESAVIITVEYNAN